MRVKHWTVGAMLTIALAPLGLRAAGGEQTRWTLGDFSWVRRAPIEQGAAPNAQPAQLSPEAIEALLAPVRATVEGKQVPLFTKAELKDLANALGEALALAQPGEDLVLASTARRDRTFARAEGVTARLFVQGGTLNLIVHDARLAFMDRWIDENIQPTFVYGARGTASLAQLQAPRAKRLRPDWLAWPLAPVPASTPAAVAVAAPVAPAPVPEAPPVPAATPVAAPAAAPAPAPAAQDEPYEAKAQRLRTLKRLRDENLISEAEYQEKRAAILKAL